VYISSSNGSTEYVTLNTNGAAPINFLTNNTERVRIDPTGLVGVGTTTPFAKISIQANNNETNRTLFAVASSTSNSTTTLFAISNTGSVTQLGGATSTFSNGLNLTAGCFSVRGNCLQIFSTTSATFFSSAGLAFSTTSASNFFINGLVFSTTTNNIFTGGNIFNASTTIVMERMQEVSRLVGVLLLQASHILHQMLGSA